MIMLPFAALAVVVLAIVLVAAARLLELLRALTRHDMTDGGSAPTRTSPDPDWTA